MMTANEIREKFLNFFAEKGHKIIPSASLIPQNDPSLLFTSAGMSPFKEYFLHPSAGLTRAVSCQKCLRTADIEEVSRTAGHHTFFEMLGNFSFGDYFKKEAIEWAWEFLTSVLDIPQQKMWVSVFEDDRESYQIWKERIKIPEQKIKRFGQKENFWPSNALKNGPNGPCGPCSEIFYDWGKEFSCGENCNLNCDCGRFIEVWNLVFTQFNRQDKKIENLENKNIDTGMGLERITAVVQGVKNDFETELFKPIVKKIISFNPAACSLQPAACNIIADYIRAIVFAIADGVIPANEKRGYVIRKLIRKAARLAEGLQIEIPFLHNLVSAVVKITQDTYPELKQEEQRIKDIINNEEGKFAQTMERAKEILRTKKRIDEKIAFELYDTYGLPYEDVENLALQKGIKLDKQKFTQYVEEQRQRSKESSGFNKQIFKGAANLSASVYAANEKERAKKQGLPLPNVWGKEEIDVARNHTATHILQSVLREILGKHIKQAGSIVFPSYFHFDFIHPKSLANEELSRVEEMVNEKNIKNDSVKKELMPKKKAIESGAIGLFEEKYGKEVTVVSVGDYSKEFCGGVHVKRTGEIGLFKIVKESSVGAGIRRIEAVSGRFAYQLIKKGEDSLKEIASLFSTSLEKTKEKAEIVFKEMKEIKKKNERFKKELFSYYAKDLAKKVEQNVIIEQFSDFDLLELREIVDVLGKKTEAGIVGLASVKNSKIYLIMNANKDLSKKVHCGQIINEVAKLMDGKGGGRADFAQASAKRVEKLPEALKVWKETIKKKLQVASHKLQARLR